MALNSLYCADVPLINYSLTSIFFLVKLVKYFILFRLVDFCTTIIHVM